MAAADRRGREGEEEEKRGRGRRGRVRRERKGGSLLLAVVFLHYATRGRSNLGYDRQDRGPEALS